MGESIGSVVLKVLLDALAVVGVVLLAFLAAIFGLAKKGR